jgi:hypothetical protein
MIDTEYNYFNYAFSVEEIITDWIEEFPKLKHQLSPDLKNLHLTGKHHKDSFSLLKLV